MAIKLGNKHLIFLFGMVCLIGVVTLVFCFDELNPAQYTVVKTIMAIGVAGVASLLPGTINVKINPGIKAVGAVAVFVLVYFFSPAPPASNQPVGSNTKVTGPTVPGEERGKTPYVNRKPKPLNKANMDKPGILQELEKKGFLDKLQEAANYAKAMTPDGDMKALTLYREVYHSLSPGSQQACNRELAEGAEADYNNTYFSHALRKYQALFDEVLKK